jgi:hypothetical protein
LRSKAHECGDSPPLLFFSASPGPWEGRPSRTALLKKQERCSSLALQTQTTEAILAPPQGSLIHFSFLPSLTDCLALAYHFKFDVLLHLLLPEALP